MSLLSTDYTHVEKIGEGTYSVVYKAKNRKDGSWVAIKKIKMDQQSGEGGMPATSLREISLLKDLNHPNVVKLTRVQCHERQLYIVFEFIDCDLKMFMDANKLFGR